MKSVNLPTLLLTAAAGALAAAAAQAQPSDNGTTNWDGVYVGANAGYNWANTEVDPSRATVNQLTGVNNGTGTVTVGPTNFTTARIDNNVGSGAWGGQIGVNRQAGSFVYGLEGDMNALYGHRAQSSSYALPPTALTTSNSEQVTRFTDPHWMASLRGRAGWAVGPMLLYGTGGVAWEDARQGVVYTYTPTVTGAVATANPGTTFGPYSNGSSRDSVRTGWTLGGGAEWALSRGISVGAEYRHSDFGHQTQFQGSTGPNATFQTTRMGLTDDSLLAKVNFRFGAGLLP